MFEVVCRDEASVKGAIEVAGNQLGNVDIMFNNAGVTGPYGEIADMDPADFEVCLLNTALYFGAFLLYVLSTYR
jgi:NAD(P)-dependent dehydrogenase (short-subunit alcohol dehydrogenase family)